MSAKFKPNLAGFRSLRNSPEVVAHLQAQAEQVAARAGDGMVVLPAERGRNRARVAVVTGTWEAQRSEATDRSLTRALGGG